MRPDGASLYAGRVTHRRLKPKLHHLAYDVFMLLVDLDRLDETAGRLKLFSLDRFNLFSLREADYGPPGPGRLRERIAGLAAERKLDWDGHAVRLVTMPRLLGYAFNPLSLYFLDNADGRLAAVIYEVRNTFGEMHHYALAVDDPEARTLHQSTAKTFYVSPFLGMGMHYRFHLKPPAERFTLAIEDHDETGLALTAALSLERQPLDDRTLFAHALRFPLVTFKVIAGIHWEALRLWLKGVPLHPRPRPVPAASSSSRAAERSLT